MATVAEMLAQSRAAHTRYRHAAGKIDAKGDPVSLKNHESSRLAIQEAHDLRAQADEADPEHTDPAWALDKVPHKELLAFYTRELARYGAA